MIWCHRCSVLYVKGFLKRRGNGVLVNLVSFELYHYILELVVFNDPWSQVSVLAYQLINSKVPKSCEEEGLPPPSVYLGRQWHHPHTIKWTRASPSVFLSDHRLDGWDHTTHLKFNSFIRNHAQNARLEPMYSIVLSKCPWLWRFTINLWLRPAQRGENCIVLESRLTCSLVANLLKHSLLVVGEFCTAGKECC